MMCLVPRLGIDMNVAALTTYSVAKSSGPTILGRHSPPRAWGGVTSPATVPLRPTELVQPGIADPEVMGHLVDDRLADLRHDLGLRRTDAADLVLVESDPVGHGPRVAARTPARQRDPLVQPEQGPPFGPTLDEDGHIVHLLPEVGR